MNLFGVTGVVAVVLVVAVVVLLLSTAAVTIGRARRLDRLHVRSDAARAGLVHALDRRAAVVRAVAAGAPRTVLDDADRRTLRAATRRAEEAGSGDGREVAENELVRRLSELDTASLPGDLAAELADAEARVVVARRVHNDAVRDTRALRGRRMVRLLRLAGTAPYPRYFDIAESGGAGSAEPVASPGAGTDPGHGSGAEAAEPGGAHPGDAPGGAHPGDAPSGPAADERGDGLAAAEPVTDPAVPSDVLVARDAARIVVLDDRERVLLFEGFDPDRPHETFWFTPGGGVEPGEEPAAAAVRELAEETGMEVGVDELTGPVWVRDVVFEWSSVTYAAREVFWVLRVPGGEIDTSGFTALEERTVKGHRWWTPTELTATVDVVYPLQLAALLTEPGGLDPGEPPIPIS